MRESCDTQLATTHRCIFLAERDNRRVSSLCDTTSSCSVVGRCWMESRKRKRQPSHNSGGKKVAEKPLGSHYKPSPADVICARGKEAQNHIGNEHFRLMIDANLERYRRSRTKKEKSIIVSNIIESVRSVHTSVIGKFIRKQDDEWYETGDDFAREKIGQCFRDRLHTDYRSSSKAKISRRKEEAAIEPSVKDFDEFMAQEPLPVSSPIVETTRKREIALLELDNRKPAPMTSLSATSAPRFERRPSPMDSIHLTGPYPNARNLFPALHQGSSTVGNVDRGQQPGVAGFLLGARLDHTTFRDSNMFGGSSGAFGNMTGRTSFVNLPVAASLNAYFGDWYSSAGPGTNTQIQDMRPSEQRLGMGLLNPTEDHHPIDMTTVAAASKGLGYPQESTWQRPERKLPPMPQSVFDGMFKSTVVSETGRDDLARKSTDDYNDDDLNDDDPLPL